MAEGAGSWHVTLPEPFSHDTCLKTSWGKASIRKHTVICDSQLFFGGNPTVKLTCLCTSVLENAEIECHFSSQDRSATAALESLRQARPGSWKQRVSWPDSPTELCRPQHAKPKVHFGDTALLPHS